MADEDEELQQWLDAQAPVEEKKPLPAFRPPTWEQMKYNFEVQLYAKAIGAE